MPYHIAGTEVYVMALMKNLYEIGIQSSVIIPNYGKDINEVYTIEGFAVLKYAEPSVIDRALQMGKRTPDGLKNFEQLILEQDPDIIHFHELAGSNGLGLAHMKLAKSLGFKTFMTFHLSVYTCKTGTLMFEQRKACDGVMRDHKCTACWYELKGITGWKASILRNGSKALSTLNIDISSLQSSISTALSFPSIIKKGRKDFDSLIYHCDAIVAISNWYMEVLRKNTKEYHKFHLIEQALPVKRNKDFQTYTKAVGVLRLVFIGRISHFKGITDLLSAIKLLPKNQVFLDIYGDSGEPEYMELCKSMSADMSNVNWKGRLAMENVVTSLSGYDVLCLPSVICEMAPLVIQEAFAAGIPVLASNVYGNAEQIKDGTNGWLFKFRDIADLKFKINELLENPKLIELAKANIPAVRSFSKVAEEYAVLYKEITMLSEKNIE